MSYVKICFSVLVICSAAQPAFCQYKVGDRLVVIAPTEIKIGYDILQTLGRGQDFRVDAINGDFLWVKHLATGWISRTNVRTPLEAVEIFTDQIEANPLDAGAFYARGITRTDLNLYDLALTDFSEAIRLAPTISCGYNGRGICWAAKGDIDRAIGDYSEAIRLNPAGTTVTYSNRALLWNTKREYAKAIDDATEAIRLTPGYVSAYSVRAQALAATKQFDDAKEDCEKIRTLTVSGLSGYNAVAWLLATSPDAEVRDGVRAIEFATRACQLTNWNDPGVLDTRAVAFAEAGNFDEAVKWETKAIAAASAQGRAAFSARLEMFKAGQPLRDPAN